MMNKLCPLLIFAVVFLLNACVKEPVIDENPVINIPVDFTVALLQPLNATDGNSLSFVVESVKAYECLNNGIDTDISVGNNSIELTLQDILEPLDCVPGTATAKAIVDLEDLNVGTYDVQIHLKNAISNEGVLTVTEDKFALVMANTDGIDILHDELHHIPKDMIWGYISYEGTQAQGTVNEFLINILNSTTALSLPDAHYGHFSIVDGLAVLEHGFLYATTQTFYYRYTEELTFLQTMVDSYNLNEANRKIELKIFTSEGLEF